MGNRQAVLLPFVAASIGLLAVTRAEAASKGLFVVVDPYATPNMRSPICMDTGASISWLEYPTCPDGITVNSVYNLLKTGSITGIYLYVHWDDYSLDTNSTTLKAAVTAINNLASAGHQVFNVKVGLIGGLHTPCAEFVKYTNEPAVPVPDPQGKNNGGTLSYRCDIMPQIWKIEMQNDYITALEGIVQTLQANLTTGGVITAIKLGGLNTNTIENHIAGNPNDANSNPTALCTGVGTQIRYTCSTTNAAATMNTAGYNPPGVVNGWENIAFSIKNYTMKTLNLTPPPQFEVDVTDVNSFPPLTLAVTQQTTPPTLPNFSCGAMDQSPCMVDNGFYGFQLDGYYFMQGLIGDLTAAVGLSASQFSVQSEGLTYQSPTRTQTPLPLPCWAFQNWKLSNSYPVIGFQFNNDAVAAGLETSPGVPSGSPETYNEGLSNGVNFGASYEELWPFEIQLYMANDMGTSTKFNVVSSALKQRSPVGSFCDTAQ